MAANSSNSSQFVHSPAIKWETSVTKALLAFLNTQKEALDALKKEHGRANGNGPLWQECSLHLVSQYNLNYTAQQYFTKFKNLSQKYKSRKDTENQSDSEAIIISFRTELDNLLNEERAIFKPVAIISSSSTSTNTSESIQYTRKKNTKKNVNSDENNSSSDEQHIIKKKRLSDINKYMRILEETFALSSSDSSDEKEEKELEDKDDSFHD
ncbi:2602_t:CDS:2 [Ambispora leptoticha]|uniref:2602_t:CDS:1 n=1 Tax=Ambispora leptoticha TaxID=144679 RepID=A0A9N9D696_9GLOM|nr:2602_t:CDS:2 [Ambispora leptoticha]